MANMHQSTTSSQVSVDKLGYMKAWGREFFLSGKDVFCSFAYGLRQIACLPYAFDIAFASDGKLGEGQATFENREAKKDGFVQLCASPLTSLKVDQKAKFVPRGMSAQFADEAQCDPRAVESVSHWQHVN